MAGRKTFSLLLMTFALILADIPTRDRMKNGARDARRTFIVIY